MSEQQPVARGAKRAVRSSQRAGPPQGSVESKRVAAAILEVLAGIRTPTDAAAALGTSIPRYYVLEQRAVQGLLTACESRPKGRVPTDSRRIVELERNVARLTRECGRQQALVRVAQRAVGLPAVPSAKPATSASAGGRKARKRRPAVRALKAVAALRDNSSSPAVSEGVQPAAPS
jgi:hypothetical protein